MGQFLSQDDLVHFGLAYAFSPLSLVFYFPILLDNEDHAGCS